MSWVLKNIKDSLFGAPSLNKLRIELNKLKLYKIMKSMNEVEDKIPRNSKGKRTDSWEYDLKTKDLAYMSEKDKKYLTIFLDLIGHYNERLNKKVDHVEKFGNIIRIYSIRNPGMQYEDVMLKMIGYIFGQQKILFKQPRLKKEFNQLLTLLKRVHKTLQKRNKTAKETAAAEKNNGKQKLKLKF